MHLRFRMRCELISNLGIFIKVFTTTRCATIHGHELWIDFKSWYIYQSIYNEVKLKEDFSTVVNWFQILVYLSKYLQPNIYIIIAVASCELISNLGIFIKVFTTSSCNNIIIDRLWIDFKSWYIYQSIYNIFKGINS